MPVSIILIVIEITSLNPLRCLNIKLQVSHFNGFCFSLHMILWILDAIASYDFFHIFAAMPVRIAVIVVEITSFNALDDWT